MVGEISQSGTMFIYVCEREAPQNRDTDILKTGMSFPKN